MQLCGNRLAVYILGLEVLFLLISVQYVYSFSTTRDIVGNRSIIANPHQRKALEPMNLWEVFANSWICLTKRPCLNFIFLIPCHWRKVPATFEKAESANSLPFAVHFHMGAYFCMCAYKCDVVVVIKMSAYIHDHGCLFCVGAYYHNFTVYLFMFWGSNIIDTLLVPRMANTLFTITCSFQKVLEHSDRVKYFLSMYT